MKTLLLKAVAIGALAAAPAFAAGEGQQATTTMDAERATTAAAMSEQEILRLQEILQQAGYYDGALDGIWGPQTEQAVQQFQQAEGLAPSGLPTPPTLAALGLSDMPGAAASLDAEGVRELQTALRQAGHYQGAIDGIWGPNTQAALVDFQQSQGLEASGALDQSTMAALGARGLGEAFAVEEDATTGGEMAQ